LRKSADNIAIVTALRLVA